MSDLDTLYNTISSCIIEISHTIRKFNPISLGATIGSENSSGEQVKELDLFCNNLLIDTNFVNWLTFFLKYRLTNQ